MIFMLYYFKGGYLCEQVENLLQMLSIEHARIDIGDDTKLGARYSERVPVLCGNSSGRELGWSFDPLALRQFVQGP